MVVTEHNEDSGITEPVQQEQHTCPGECSGGLRKNEVRSLVGIGATGATHLPWGVQWWTEKE